MQYSGHKLILFSNKNIPGKPENLWVGSISSSSPFLLWLFLCPSFHHLYTGLGSVFLLPSIPWMKWLRNDGPFYFQSNIDFNKPDWSLCCPVPHEGLFKVYNFIINLLNILNKFPQQALLEELLFRYLLI